MHSVQYWACYLAIGQYLTTIYANFLFLTEYQLTCNYKLFLSSVAGSKEITIASIVIRNDSGLRLPSDNGYVCVYLK